MRRFLRPFFVVLALIAGGLTATVATAAPSIPIYRAHVQNVGWLPNTEPTLVGDIAGLPGSGLRVEALQVSRDIQLQAHVQNVGWMAPVTPDGVAGTTGRSLRLEAIKATSMIPGYHVECEAIVPGAGTVHAGDGGVCGTVGRSLLVEAFRLRLVADGATEPTASPTITPTATSTPTQTATPPVTPPASGSARIAFTADTGYDASNGNGVTTGVFKGIAAAAPDFAAIIGDLGYDPGHETAYCDFVKKLYSGPVEILAGNHEDASHGGLGTYATCLPNRAAVSAGDYARQYVIDQGPVRLVMIDPAIDLSPKRTYADGTPEQAWLKTKIAEGKAAGQWIIVAYHKPCLTIGLHGCASSPQLSNLMIKLKVDLVLTGHDHNYSRSFPLTGTVTSPVVATKSGIFPQGTGTVFATIGNGGHDPRTITGIPSWVAAASGTNFLPNSFGFLQVDATTGRLVVNEVVTSGGALRDSFTITR